jgi:hypothetical protein
MLLRCRVREVLRRVGGGEAPGVGIVARGRSSHAGDHQEMQERVRLLEL